MEEVIKIQDLKNIKLPETVQEELSNNKGEDE